MAYIDVKDECKRYQTGDTTIMANDHVTFGVEKGELAIAPIADRVIHMHDGRVTSVERNLAPQAIADIEW